MDFLSYQAYFNSILDGANRPEPYNDPAYLHYTKLNWSRQQRWLKTGVLLPELSDLIRDISRPMTWTVITEPWCGDAAHVLPLIYRLSLLNPLISLDIRLRDTPPFLIDSYLTGKSRSIPKFIVRTEDGPGVLVWGPRPQANQALYEELKHSDTPNETIKERIQQWYNADKGQSFQQELLAGLKEKFPAPEQSAA